MAKAPLTTKQLEKALAKSKAEWQRMNNLWSMYQAYLKETRGLNDTVVQFLSWVERSDWISKDDFHCMG